MFVTSKLIYLELQKTACTHIGSLLKNYVGGKKEGKHNWLTDFETEKMIVGSIRNPWTWYISLWAFGCGKKGGLYTRLTKRSLSIILKDIFKLKFRNAWCEITKPTKQWKSYYATSENPDLFRNWIKLVFEKQRQPDLREGFSDSSLSDFTGFMTYRYSKLHMKDFYKKEVQSKIKDYDDLVQYDKSNNLLDEVIRMENLEEDFIRIIDKAGHSIDEKTKNKIMKKTEKKQNVSKHHGASFYYDDETKNLVEEDERFLIEKYKYTFPTNND